MTWIHYTTARGKDLVREERDELLDDYDDARLDLLLEEVEASRAIAGADFKKLRSRYNLWEVRFDAEGCTYRLVYTCLPGGQRLLLALSFAKKRGDSEQRKQIARAETRLKDWHKRHR